MAPFWRAGAADRHAPTVLDTHDAAGNDLNHPQPAFVIEVDAFDESVALDDLLPRAALTGENLGQGVPLGVPGRVPSGFAPACHRAEDWSIQL